MANNTLLLTKSDLESLITIQDMISTIEDAFRKHGEGKSFGMDMIHGVTPSELEFHIKVGGITLGDKKYYGLKINASNFSNMDKHGLPNIIGAILLFDGTTGFPLAIVDSIIPTILRTGAGTAVAMKYLARPDSKIATICGCGTQGRIQLRSIKTVLPLERVFAFDMDYKRAEIYANEMTDELGMQIESVKNLEEATVKSDVIITCTPSKSPFLRKEYVNYGTTIGAIGADSPDKQELETKLLKGNKVVVDILKQCAVAGELHHALEEKLITITDVHAELGEILTGKKTGREKRDEIIIYDATGTAIQDTASVAVCYEKAVSKNIGTYIALNH
ncbi:MAG: ornithine cyclodeaminase family protein [Candidatus Lokiarchaeota archaeon]|nr:ornithine cyclodeaminase family protein [Candidatus Lokiarchaeota archaeon]